MRFEKYKQNDDVNGTKRLTVVRKKKTILQK